MEIRLRITWIESDSYNKFLERHKKLKAVTYFWSTGSLLGGHLTKLIMIPENLPRLVALNVNAVYFAEDEAQNFVNVLMNGKNNLKRINVTLFGKCNVDFRTLLNTSSTWQVKKRASGLTFMRKP